MDLQFRFDGESHRQLKIAFSSHFNEPILCSPVSLDLKQSHTFLEIQLWSYPCCDKAYEKSPNVDELKSTHFMHKKTKN